MKKEVSDMSLEKFTKQQVATWPAVTIRRNGTLSLNSYAVDAYNLKESRFATLFFDKAGGVMAIKPAKDDAESSSFRISKEKNRTHVISCQSFLRHCEIPYKDGAKIYRAGFDEKRGMILVKIS